MSARCGLVAPAVAFGAGRAVEAAVPADPSRTRMLTARDVRERLNVCATTLYRLVASGELRATKVGRDYRFLLCDVDRFLGRHDAHIGRAVDEFGRRLVVAP